MAEENYTNEINEKRCFFYTIQQLRAVYVCSIVFARHMMDTHLLCNLPITYIHKTFNIFQPLRLRRTVY